jgi:hypothetical protein
MCYRVHNQACHIEPPIRHKEFLKIDEKRFICQITDNSHAIKRYSQFLRSGGYAGGFHVYYDGPGFAKIPFFRHCSRDVLARSDEAGPGWRSPRVTGRPSCFPVGNGCRDNDLGNSQGRVERTAGSEADNPPETLRQTARCGYGCCCASDADTVGDRHDVTAPACAHLSPMDGQGDWLGVFPACDPRLDFAAV